MGERVHRLFDPNEKEPSTDASQGALARAGCSSNRLFLSLLSGLPNEQEFALGAFALLSGMDPPPLLSPRMLEVLVAQAGVWTRGPCSLGDLFSESWRGVEGRCMQQFWHATLPKMCTALGVDTMGVKREEEEPFLQLDHLRAEGRRVTEVALILHNLSFEKYNVSVLVNSAIFIRFLLLCIHSSWSNLKQTAFDTLANIAEEVQLCDGEKAADLLLLRVVLEGVCSGDRFVSLRSMDALAQLCTRNEHLLTPYIDTQVCDHLVSLVSVHDVLLLHHSLDALHAVSQLGMPACECIARSPGAVGALVSLLTLDPAQYGLEGLKLVEVRPAEEDTSDPAQLKVPVAVPASTSSQQLINKEVDSETFASNWLHGQYDACAGSCVPQDDIYASYVGFCTKAQRKVVMSAAAFAEAIKVSFPQVEPRQASFHGLRKKGAQGPYAQEKTVVPAKPSVSLQLSTPSLANKVRPSPPVLVSGLQKMVILSSPRGQVRCMVPQVNLQAVVKTQVNGLQAANAEVPSKAASEQMNSAQNNEEASSNVQKEAASDQSFILSGIQGNTVTYRLAGPGDLAPLKLGNRLFVRSKPEPKGVVSPKPKENICAKSPLLNGLLDKGRPTRDILFHALVENGIRAEPTGSEYEGGVVRMTAAAQEGGVVRLHIESPENSSQGSPDLSSLSDIARTLECASETISRTNAQCNTPNSELCAISGRGNQISATSLVANHVVCQREATSTIMNSISNNTVSESSIVTLGSSILGATEIVVGGAGTKKLIDTCSGVPSSGNFIGPNRVATLAANPFSGNIIRTLDVNSVVRDVNGQSVRTLAMNSLAGNFVRTLAVNSLPGNISGQSVGNLSINSVSNNIVRTLAVNSMTGSVIRTRALNSVAGNIVGPRSENVAVNTVAGNVLGQGVGTLVVNSVAGNVLSQGSPVTLALNSVGGNVVRTLSMNSVAGQDVGSLALNSAAGNVIKTVEVNSVAGNVVSQGVGNLTLNSVAGGRTGQQIFVVASPGSGTSNIKFCILHTLPNSTEDPNSGVATNNNSSFVFSQNSGRELSGSLEATKRPSTEPVVSVVVKKPRTEPSVKAEEELLPAAVSKVSQPTSTKLEFICEWKNCRKKFSKPGRVFVHASHAHCSVKEEAPCLWEGCDNMRRSRFSLLTHMQDWHCNEHVLQLQAARRVQVASCVGSRLLLPPPPHPPLHPGYAPDAALLAIKRQHPKGIQLEEEEEGALAKSARLTSALVLRNLVTHSARARTYLRRFESELALVAMSSGESSKAVAQCLAQLAR